VLALAIGRACSSSLFHESAKKERATTVVNVPPHAQADIVVAVVAAIDHQSGVVVLDSAVGRLLTIATPAQLHDLHTGDLVLVHLSREDRQKEYQQGEESEDTLMI
jgi:hypothetical protein